MKKLYTLILTMMLGLASQASGLEPWQNYNLAESIGSMPLFSGTAEKSQLGRHLTNLGDMDGDGLSEWGLAALPKENEEGGSIYILSGDNWPLLFAGGADVSRADARLLAQERDVEYRLLNSDSRQKTGFGLSMTPAGDINGDGYGDIAIGVPFFAVNDAEDTGRLLFVMGSKNFFSSDTLISFDSQLVSKDVESFFINGSNRDDHFGFSLGSGDIDGDGLRDVAVGAYRWGEDERGAVYVLWGNEEKNNSEDKSFHTMSDIESGLTDGSVSILNGLHPEERLGSSVHVGGDMNRSGTQALLMSSYGYNSGAGRVYIVLEEKRFSGKTNPLENRQNNVLVLDGRSAYNEAGWTIRSGGDFNNDGYDDALIGTRRSTQINDEEANDGGSLTVLYGRSDLRGRFALEEVGKSLPGFRLEGSLFGTSGFEIGVFSDVNGDSFDDIAVSVPKENTNKGRIMLIFGGVGLTSAHNSHSSHSYDIERVVMGESKIEGLILEMPSDENDGDVVVGGDGDANGDGLADFLVSLPLANVDGVKNVGKTYIFFGRPYGTQYLTGSDVADDLSTEMDKRLVILGYEGDDTIRILHNDFHKIHGGKGTDTLVVEGNTLYWGGVVRHSIQDIEIVDLRKEAVKFHLEESALIDETLEILADEDDQILLEGFVPLSVVDGKARYLAKNGTSVVVLKSNNVKLLKEGEIVPPEQLADMGVQEGLLVEGNDVNVRLGYAVSGVGDIDGDNIDDFALGIVYAGDEDNKRRGQVMLVYGARGGHVRHFGAREVIEPSLGVRIDGEKERDRLGWSLAGGVDINGDGFDDMVVGVPYGGENGEGLVHVLFGRSNGWSGSDAEMMEATRGLVIVGEKSGDLTGWSVGVSRDMNGDGLGEIIVGVPHGDGKGDAKDGQNNGRVLILYGSKNLATEARTVLHIEADRIGKNVAGVRLEGTKTGGRLGWSVAGLGDIDGDGLGDIGFGAPSGGDFTRIKEGLSDGNHGRVYLLSGRRDGNISLQSAYVLEQKISDERLGFSIGGGDINGDGLDDILMGSPRSSGDDTGYVALLLGRSDIFAKARIVDLQESSAFKIYGEVSGSRFGHAVDVVRDRDGDGSSEFLVSSPRFGGVSASERFTGAVYVIDGSVINDDSFTRRQEASVSNFRFDRLEGRLTGEQIGQSIAALGDVNGDGNPDIALGSYYGDTAGRNNSGIVYVVYGGR